MSTRTLTYQYVMFTDGTRPASIKSCQDAQNSCGQYASGPTSPDLRARPAPMNCPGFRQSQPTNGTVGALPDGVVGEPGRISAGGETQGCQPAHVDAGRRGPLVSFGFSGTARSSDGQLWRGRRAGAGSPVRIEIRIKSGFCVLRPLEVASHPGDRRRGAGIDLAALSVRSQVPSCRR